MPSNDDVVWGMPTIQCPSCKFTLDLSETSSPHIQKYSKAQREKMYCKAETEYDSAKSSYETVRMKSLFDREDAPSMAPENVFTVVTCSNARCEQYNKLKVLRIPRISTPSIKVDL